MDRLPDAIDNFGNALALNPGCLDFYLHRGLAFARMRRHSEAIADFEKTLAIDPRQKYALSFLASSYSSICSWDRADALAEQMRGQLIAGEIVVQPFTCLGYQSDPSIHLLCARNYAKDLAIDRPSPCSARRPKARSRLKLAYLSADFRDHAVARTIAELFELHDRSRFEVIGVSFGRDDGGQLRSRLVRSFDQFLDLRSQSDKDAAGILSRLEIDIAVDLTGYTDGSRPGILAFRPAPIQVNYLGYPGTMGAGFIDYVLADRFVLPLEDQPFYDEKIVHLPNCYQPNDSKRKVSPVTPSRREVGLAEDAFVFCCFNNNYKMAAPVFDIWMGLLGTVEKSVLWLFARDDLVKENLRRETAARGIDPARVIFIEKLLHEEYLAHHALADLFLDTLPYNAHATGSNALWTGLPLLTCRGNTFAGRVGTSLLHAVGLPEMVTNSLEEYEAVARKLATDRDLLQSIRRKLEENRGTCPLFDTDRFRRHIEEAYSTMWETYLRSERPRGFAVPSASVAAG